MFDLFSWSHILILVTVALVVVGPKDLPKLMRTAGQWAGKARAMANEFRASFDEMARQSELDELRKEIDALRHNNPLADVHRELNQSIIPPDMQSVQGGTVSAENVMTPIAPEAAPESEPAPEPVIEHEQLGEEPALPDPQTLQGSAYRPPAP